MSSIHHIESTFTCYFVYTHTWLYFVWYCLSLSPLSSWKALFLEIQLRVKGNFFFLIFFLMEPVDIPFPFLCRWSIFSRQLVFLCHFQSYYCVWKWIQCDICCSRYIALSLFEGLSKLLEVLTFCLNFQVLSISDF